MKEARIYDRDVYRMQFPEVGIPSLIKQRCDVAGIKCHLKGIVVPEVVYDEDVEIYRDVSNQCQVIVAK